MTVLVTSASGAKGLVVTRSLGKENIDVVTTDSEKYSAAFFSRYSKEHFLTPSASVSPDNYVESILAYVQNNDIDLLMPVNSIETLLICKNKNKFLPHTILPFEDYNKMTKLHDKGELAKVADELNMPIPKTYNFTCFEEIERCSFNLDYPVVIKLKNATSSVGISYAYSQRELLSKYKETILKFNLHPMNYPIVQEYISGDGYGVSVLMNHGELRAIFTHKRLREYPLTGGPSTLRESVRHPEMEEIAVKLLKHFEWHGVAMVEFKLNKYTNKPVLLEVNPRFWGSINQAIASGVNFPVLLYEMATEGDIKPVLNYKTGVKTRFFMNECRALFTQIRHSSNQHPSLVETLKMGRMNDDVISFNDPLPTLLFTYTNMKQSLGRSKKHGLQNSECKTENINRL